MIEEEREVDQNLEAKMREAESFFRLLQKAAENPNRGNQIPDLPLEFDELQAIAGDDKEDLTSLINSTMNEISQVKDPTIAAQISELIDQQDRENLQLFPEQYQDQKQDYSENISTSTSEEQERIQQKRAKEIEKWIDELVKDIPEDEENNEDWMNEELSIEDQKYYESLKKERDEREKKRIEELEKKRKQFEENIEKKHRKVQYIIISSDDEEDEKPKRPTAQQIDQNIVIKIEEDEADTQSINQNEKQFEVKIEQEDEQQTFENSLNQNDDEKSLQNIAEKINNNPAEQSDKKAKLPDPEFEQFLRTEKIFDLDQNVKSKDIKDEAELGKLLSNSMLKKEEVFEESDLLLMEEMRTKKLQDYEDELMSLFGNLKIA